MALLLALQTPARAADPGPGTTPPPPPAWTPVELGAEGAAGVAMASGRYWCQPFPGYSTWCQIVGVAGIAMGEVYFRWSTDGGTTWQNERVDQGSAASDISLAFNGSTPFISYHDENSNKLVVARKISYATGTKACGAPGLFPVAWECTKGPTYGGYKSAIAVDDAGVVYVAHHSTVGNLYLSKLAPPYSSSSFTTLASRTLELPLSIDLEVDDIHQIHLAWSTATQIKYAMKYQSLASQIFDPRSIVIRDTFATGSSDAGQVALAVNWSERPSIAYTARAASGSTVVRHTFMTNATDWVTEHVSTLVGLVGGPNNRVGIALDDDEDHTVAISFGRADASGEKSTAFAYPQSWGWGWSTSTVTGSYDPDGSGPIGLIGPESGGRWGSVVRLDSGKFLVSYQDEAQGVYWILRQN
jgi:hypothetical protein